jgi:predicted RNase H-like HicB family nuclease
MKGDLTMPVTVELIPDPEQGGLTARLPDIPAYGEGETEEEAIADLREAIRGYIETFGLEDAMNRLNSPRIRHVEWDCR